jgi:hypothetical protein
MNIRSAIIAAAAGCTLLVTSNLSAQIGDRPDSSKKPARWTFQVPGGTIVPTGSQRHAIKRGNLTAAQLAFIARPTFAVTSTFGWARSRDIATAGDPKLDVFTYDVGGEVRAPEWRSAKGMTVSPFAGAGAGGRSYNYRKLDVDATHNAAGFVSAGAELGVRRVRLRLEARDYVTDFKPLDGAGASRTGNDVVITAGVRLVSR